MEASMLTNQTLAGGPVLKGTHTLKYNNVWRTSRDEERSQANYFYVFFVFFNETADPQCIQYPTSSVTILHIHKYGMYYVYNPPKNPVNSN